MDTKIQFNNNLVDLIKLLRQKIKDIKDTNTHSHKLYKTLLNDYYKNYSENLEKNFLNFVADFIKNISTYGNYIITNDEMLFSDDIFKNPVCILKDIDFKFLWKLLNDEDKNYCWKKLKFLYLLGNDILKKTQEYKSLYEKQKEIMAKLVEGMTQKHDLEKEIKRQQIEEDIEDRINYEDIKDKFGDNIFSDIIIEIIKEFNIDKSIDPSLLSNIINDFSNGNNDKVNPTIEKIIEKVKAKLVERNMTEQELIDEILKVKDKFNEFFNGIPQLKDLMDKLASEAKELLSGKKTKEDINTEFTGFENDMSILKDITSRLAEIDMSGLLNN